MIILPVALIIIVLFIVIYQDLKFRTIHILLPILLMVLALCYNVVSFKFSLETMLLNIGFILVNIIGVVFYFSLKNKKLVNPVDSLIGLGDICFFVAITPLFNLRGYILYFVIALIGSLIIHLIENQFKKTDSIPLAGYMSMVLIVFLTGRDVLNINLV